MNIDPYLMPIEFNKFFWIKNPHNREICGSGYLNYPTQVVFKSCKLIPVLIGGILLQRKKFSPMDFVAAISMCVGLAIFTLADSKLSPSFDSIGMY